MLAFFLGKIVIINTLAQFLKIEFHKITLNN